jgi:membrane protein implicated in regulation of membrane protease activity
MAIIFFIIEIFTPGFVLACFGIGFLVTALVSSFKASFEIQILIFSITTLVVFFGIRPFVLKYFFNKEESKIQTNVNALIGKNARVTVKIDPPTYSGRVAIEGDDWRAISIDEKSIDVGTIVKITRVDGTKLFVEEVKSQNEEI